MRQPFNTAFKAICAAFLAVAILLSPTKAAEMIACDLAEASELSTHADADHADHAHTSDPHELASSGQVPDHCASHACVSALAFVAPDRGLVGGHFGLGYAVDPGGLASPESIGGIRKPPRA